MKSIYTYGCKNFSLTCFLILFRTLFFSKFLPLVLDNIFSFVTQNSFLCSMKRVFDFVCTKATRRLDNQSLFDFFILLAKLDGDYHTKMQKLSNLETLSLAGFCPIIVFCRILIKYWLIPILIIDIEKMTTFSMTKGIH